MKRRIFTLVATIAMMAGMLAGPASAGEITGNGKPTAAPDNARSICAFSGLDDPDDDPFGRTQSYGQVVRLGFAAEAPNPGLACNPNTEFEE